MSRERMSRPSSSDPQICSSEGGAKRVARLMCAGSAGAIQGAKTAQMTKNVTNTAPIAASGLLRARRGSEIAGVEMGFTYLLSFRVQQDGGEATILRSREPLNCAQGRLCFIADAGRKQVPRLRPIFRKRMTELRSE